MKKLNHNLFSKQKKMDFLFRKKKIIIIFKKYFLFMLNFY